MKVLIVNGGSLTAEFLHAQYQAFAPDRVIAVDGALEYFFRTGLRVTHIVGDFDTVAPEILSAYRDGEYVIEQHVPEKDETDSELAMELALSFAPEEILVLGATGRRLDHALANLQLLYVPFSAGVSCRIVDEYNEIRLIDAKNAFSADEGWKYFSLLPFTEQVEGITLTGFKYPLTGHCMKRGVMPGFGVSNEIVQKQAVVDVKKGILFCIRSKDR